MPRDEAVRLRRLIAEKQAADDRRRALLAEADAAAQRAEWSAVVALADEVLASDKANAPASSLREKAVAALAAETRRRREQCERAIGRAEQLARSGRYAEAESALDEASRANPESPSSLTWRSVFARHAWRPSAYPNSSGVPPTPSGPRVPGSHKGSGRKHSTTCVRASLRNRSYLVSPARCAS